MTKILVIEDEGMLREEVMDWLTFEDYEAIGAEDGLAGVVAAARHLPDLIVCDVTMPRLNGYGVLLEINANPRTAGIPFIFMTARASHDDIREGMSLGADDYITKPFTRLELLQTIRARLEKKATQQRHQQNQIDELQEALAQEHENRLLKAKLVAMFSHDFRNPLAAILSANSLLRDYGDRLDENRRRQHMTHIDAAVRQLLQMLDDMLVVAQLETGHLDVTAEPLNISLFIQEIVEEFVLIHGSTHQLFFESVCHEIIMADPRLLRQIAANLISNAIKYSPQNGEVRVELECHDSACILSVQDQGIGIPEADQAHLFDGFRRGSNVENVSGTGLGLAIVKQAVDLQGGSIHLQSQVGIGTRIVVTIPCIVPGA